MFLCHFTNVYHIADQPSIFASKCQTNVPLCFIILSIHADIFLSISLKVIEFI